MIRQLLWLALVLACCGSSIYGQENGKPVWKAGVAKVVITPRSRMWMSGYAGRDKPAEGKLHDLWAKALVAGRPRGNRGRLVTLDLVGVDRELSRSSLPELETKVRLRPREAIILSSSHTHTGPVVRAATSTPCTSSTKRSSDASRDYTRGAAREAGSKSSARRWQAWRRRRLSWGTGRRTFAVNRRNNKEADVPKLIEPKGRSRGRSITTCPCWPFTTPTASSRASSSATPAMPR